MPERISHAIPVILSRRFIVGSYLGRLEVKQTLIHVEAMLCAIIRQEEFDIFRDFVKSVAGSCHVCGRINQSP